MKVRVHFAITTEQDLFLSSAFPGISKSEALRRIIDESIVRKDWEPPVLPITVSAEGVPTLDVPGYDEED